MPVLNSDMSAVFTASAICMGSWRGTTEVMMITHFNSNSCVVRLPFFRPSVNTYPAATKAKMSSTSSA